MDEEGEDILSTGKYLKGQRVFWEDGERRHEDIWCHFSRNLSSKSFLRVGEKYFPKSLLFCVQNCNKIS